MKALLLVLLMSSAAHVEAAKKIDISKVLGGPEVITERVRMVLANVIVLERFETPLCRKAYRERFRLDPAEEYFDPKYTIGMQHGFMPMGSIVRGATHCESSVTNMILSDFWVNISDVDDTAAVIMHEFLHLLQCQQDPPLPDSEHKDYEEAMQLREKEAYVITDICMGVAPKLTIQQYNFTPKGFEQWDGKTN
jgi:hypothetical protein